MTAGKKNVLTAAAAVVLLILLAALAGALTRSQRQTDAVLRRPSTFFSDPSGTRAALLIARELLESAEPWTRPLAALPDPGEQGRGETTLPAAPDSLVVAGPRLPISRADADRLDRWLRRGGQLICALDADWPIRSAEADAARPHEAAADGLLARYGLQVRGGHWEQKLQLLSPDSSPDSPPGELMPIDWDAAVGPEAADVAAARPATLELSVQPGTNVEGPPERMIVLASRPVAGPAAVAPPIVVAAAVEVGRGRIVVVPDAGFLSNQRLADSDNAVLLISLLAARRRSRAAFDEYHHGFGAKRSMLALAWAFSRTPWGWAVWTLLAAGGLYVFGYRRRLGRAAGGLPRRRRSGLELLEARAGLFRAAGAEALARERIAWHEADALTRRETSKPR